MEEKGGRNLFEAFNNSPLHHIDPLGLKCKVASLSMIVNHWLISNPSPFKSDWERRLYVSFKLALDPCSEPKDCIIDQKMTAYIEQHTEAVLPGIYVPYTQTLSDAADVGEGWSQNSYWNGTTWAYEGLGAWSKGCGSPQWRATFFDMPGHLLRNADPREFPVYYGGIGKTGWAKFRTRVVDSSDQSEQRSLTWGILIDYKNFSEGTHDFTLNP
jgi:hypothetical protein